MKEFHNDFEEFFYDDSFDDYDNDYIIYFNKKTTSGNVYTENISIIQNTIDVFLHKPIYVTTHNLNESIGKFHCNKNEIGIYGFIEYYDLETEKLINTLLKNFCYLIPFGSGMTDKISREYLSYTLHGIFIGETPLYEKISLK